MAGMQILVCMKIVAINKNLFSYININVGKILFVTSVTLIYVQQSKSCVYYLVYVLWILEAECL